METVHARMTAGEAQPGTGTGVPMMHAPDRAAAEARAREALAHLKAVIAADYEDFRARCRARQIELGLIPAGPGDRAA
jgi:hypothetical protein